MATESPRPSMGSDLPARIRRRRLFTVIGAVSLLVLSVAVSVIAVSSVTGRTEIPPADVENFPDLAEVRCDETGTVVLTKAVRPRADGLHIRVVNEMGPRAGLSLEYPNGAGSGQGLPAKENILIYPAPPGLSHVHCTDATPESMEAPSQTLEVVDSDGVYTRAELDCEGGGVTDSSGGLLPEGARGEKGDPVELTRAKFEGELRPGDEVRSVGYPEVTDPSVAVIRDGRVLLVQRFMPDGPDRWTDNGYEACDL